MRSRGGKRAGRAVSGGVGEIMAGVSDTAARYHRISTVGQEDGFSLEYQSEATAALADKLGLVVAPEHVLDEVETAANPYRPKYERLWNLVQNQEVGHVLVYRSDRLARDPLLAALFARHCKDHGVGLHFADGTKVESSTDEMVQFVMGWGGHEEREKTRKQTMEGKRKRAENNGIPNGTGAGLYGTDYDPETKRRTINEREAEVVRKAFGWRLRGKSYGEIARMLNMLGIPSRGGGLWSPATVRAMLTNIAYTGVQWYGKRRYEKSYEPGGPKRRVTEKPPEEWIRVEGFTPKIIEPAVFEAAGRVGVKRSRKGMVWDYELTEFAYCGECDSQVCGATMTANGTSRRFSYPYYRCEGTLGDHYRPKICDLKSLRADKLEPVVDKFVEEAVRNPDGFLEVIRRETSDGGAKLERRVAGKKRELKKKQDEADGLTLQVAKKLIKQARYERLMAPLNVVIERLEEELALLVSQKGAAENLEAFEKQVRATFLQYKEGLSTLDKEGRQQLMRLLNVRVTCYRGRVLVTGVLDPSLFTTERTWACSSNWAYTVVLKPRPGDWPAGGRKRGPRSKWAR